jgi:hypothetical protein
LGDVVELEAGPYDFEWYWETWEGILNSAQFKDENGNVWYLHHDGDLFAATASDLEKMEDLS